MKVKSSSDSHVSLLSQVVLEGMHEIMGQGGMNAVFNLANLPHLSADRRFYLQNSLDSREMSTIQLTLERLYGPRSGRGIILRSGRAAFKALHRWYGEELGLTSFNYRLLPTSARIRAGLETLADLFSEIDSGLVRVSEDESSWFWRVENCIWCQGRQSQETICHFMVGLLEEFASWAGGSKVYHVWETECRGTGKPACVVCISKRPLD